ncbi:MAG: phosphoribosylformylglycinamidine cyclo-ligase [Candidatus Dormibacteria bacterium]
MSELRYVDAGVDVEAGNRAVELIREHVASTRTPQVLAGIGPFAGVFDPGSTPGQVLVATTDSVGTKVKVAIALREHRGIGIDLVNHCIDDVLTTGAEPAFFLDYFATGRLVPEQVAEIIEGAALACRSAGCAILGGETAELPGLYALGDYDIAGFMVGIAARERLLDVSAVQAGDVLVGMPSNGLHTNGYSLARQALQDHDLRSQVPALGGTLGAALLATHTSYLEDVRRLRAEHRLVALAHITGGGIPGNLGRALPGGLAAELDRDSWTRPPIFEHIRAAGGVPEDDMWTTFNMGLGMIAVVRGGTPDWLPEVGRVVEQHGPETVRIR